MKNRKFCCNKESVNVDNLGYKGVIRGETQQVINLHFLTHFQHKCAYPSCPHKWGDICYQCTVAVTRTRLPMCTCCSARFLNIGCNIRWIGNGKDKCNRYIKSGKEVKALKQNKNKIPRINNPRKQDQRYYYCL